MSFEFGMKGYTFGLIAVICWVVSVICSFIGLAFVGNIAGIAVLVLGIMAFVNGKKELAADPTNAKAKAGKNIGLVIIILEIVTFVAILAISGMLIGLAMA
ncbi:hypothetical protein [Eubacterium callanderi]|uniref:hypothetical protein n=1 Tax=Eubacterium callanderi TaxID=53442 RepID=UPI001A996C98|nr:hypothetical protein [Eubacterium callanderi]MBU5303122.1 hypothetical protein [Eubacterium callanderi]WPK65909.1 hypothetical protein EUCA2A_00290 [Eubacterium callanderi]WPK70207.1 hypothetical protein EUCA11A_00290 [Eubacterium callanderi]GFZ25646.1 hypothetical protein CMETHOX_35690 [[Clostridium] methoxybenzovorans]